MAKMRTAGAMSPAAYKEPSPRQRMESRVKSLVEDSLGYAATAAKRKMCEAEIIAILDKHAA